MLILLPPSEAKRAGGHQRGEAGPLPRALARARKEVAADLKRLLRRADAADCLLLPPSVAPAALATNRLVANAPVRPALDRYAGVLYDGLDAASMTAVQRSRADRDVLVFSGLFGVVRGGEDIPDYRVPAKTKLPTLGVAGTYWRSVLAAVMDDALAGRYVLDLRSTDYAAMWAPRADAADRLVTVRVLSRKPDGQHGIVSYTSKLYKGKLARAVVASAVDTPDGLLEAWQAVGGLDARPRPVRHGTAWDLVVD